MLVMSTQEVCGEYESGGGGSPGSSNSAVSYYTVVGIFNSEPLHVMLLTWRGHEMISCHIEVQYDVFDIVRIIACSTLCIGLVFWLSAEQNRTILPATLPNNSIIELLLLL